LAESCKCEEQISAIQTESEENKSAMAVTTTPTYTNCITSANTVEEVNIRLFEMEQHWVQTQSNPFPKKKKNAMTDLRVALVI
jgi:predicted RNase H-like HicB family nuclease